MFDSNGYRRQALEFANAATGSEPGQVSEMTGRVGDMAGWLQMANDAANNDAEEQFAQLLREAVESLEGDWTAVLASLWLAADPSASGHYVAVCSRDALVDGVLPGPVPGIRLFFFSTFRGEETNCSPVELVGQAEWEKRRASQKRRQEEAAFDTPLVGRMKLLFAAALAVLTDHAKAQSPPSSHVARLLDELGTHIVRFDGEGTDLPALLDMSKGLDGASRLTIMTALALGLEPSKVLAEAEARVSAFHEG